jgi:hypothetical protein
MDDIAVEDVKTGLSDQDRSPLRLLAVFVGEIHFANPPVEDFLRNLGPERDKGVPNGEALVRLRIR